MAVSIYNFRHREVAAATRLGADLEFALIGYSWKTNQYGLTIDTVTAFELVKPDGIVVTVTKAGNPTLFSALKVHRSSNI